MLQGYGRSSTGEGLFYEGYFVDGKKEGYGVEVQPNSDCYFGEFHKDKKDGIGLYLFAKGGYYYGFFRSNEKSDMGVVYSKISHSFYFGEFQNDKKNGRGMEVYKDHSVYNGFYENNKRSGVGIMEYSNKSTYMGDWKHGQRSGKGRFEAGEKVTSGNWEYDRIKFASAVDLDELMKPLYERKLPNNFEQFYKSTGHRFVPLEMPNVSLNACMRPALIDCLKLRAAKGYIRGHIFRKISNILDNNRVLRDVSDRIYKAFTKIPDHNKVFSPIGQKVDFKFQSGEYKIRWWGINFDNKKKPVFSFDHMIISNDIIFGFGKEERTVDYQLDGVCLPDGIVQIYQQFTQGKEGQRYTCLAGPNYLAGVDQDENKVFLIPELEMWKGFFITAEDVSNKIPIAVYMRIFGGEKIYGFGRDKIGIYMVSGEVKAASEDDADQKPVLEFMCHYERDFAISMNGRLEHDEIVS